MHRYQVRFTATRTGIRAFPGRPLVTIDASNPAFALRQVMSSSGLKMQRGQSIEILLSDLGPLPPPTKGVER